MLNPHPQLTTGWSRREKSRFSSRHKDNLTPKVTNTRRLGIIPTVSGEIGVNENDWLADIPEPSEYTGGWIGVNTEYVTEASNVVTVGIMELLT